MEKKRNTVSLVSDVEVEETVFLTQNRKLLIDKY